MTHPPGIDDLREFLASGDWKSLFSDSVLAAGFKAARAKRVTGTRAELLDTGDIEVVGTVIDPEGHQDESTLAFWLEEGRLQVDTDCTCPVRSGCVHSAAVLEHLSRPNRLEKAFGKLPENTPAPTQQLDAEKSPAPAESPSITFRLHIKRRPNNDDFPWLPETYATAIADYGTKSYPLDPAGNIARPRDRAAESNALNTLYALDLIPGAETPPVSLKKLPTVDEISTLWAPDSKQWQPSLYWQRFRHEGIAALEKRGWKVTLAHDVGHKPLAFNASTWKAEIVEEGRGWFHLSAGFEVDGEQIELQPVLATLVEYNFLEITRDLPDGQQFLIFLPDGRGLTLPVGRFRRILTHLGELMDFKFDGKKMRLHKVEAAAVAETLEQDLESETPEEIKTLALASKTPNKASTPVPNTLKAELRSYQEEGYQWMQFLANNELHGILADDMGLGKTMQTLTHILAEKEKGNTLPNLVVAPTSVVENWQREAAKFAPSLKVVILQGADRYQRYSQLPNCDIALTSYALLHRDLEPLSSQPFHLLVLDEAQHIKNPGAQVTTAVKQLDSRHRVCLSGTPVENHLGELWSLFEFLMPGLLGTSETFRETFRNPIEKDGNQQRADALAHKVGPLILRRTKDQVATELPPKTEIPHLIELGEHEKDLYETVRATMDKHVRQALAIRGQQAQMVFLDALLKLRQICCHPNLVDTGSLKTENLKPNTSSKFNYLTDLLATLKEEGRRVLIFSQFTSMLDIIEQHLVEQDTSYLKLTGATKNRQDLVEDFQAGKAEVFLISLKAGGTGLTLTNADTVIHYDPWWNPAAENQATDRAYRIGQDKPVFVHKLICQGTVEQRIQQMQEKKAGISDSILTASLNTLKLNDDILTNLLAPIHPTEG
ncbi:DEAD/DEAH box helicase [Verrucomicrobiaceae bacterium 5K15]|uniref:DEAD/DEAH box helicase n=1 Tax=Oceaniferula flava TaxID=2800421 RepID=A0AAE2S9R7_9BACT|nr:DEAD/DEAH box helicase [Oceaniferula flavus]MBK1854000.1 DEAD/DEAH box helicase [Oceaniferula flavus]MBM1135306.1 DEAD/DEAH box helicase [Oceaniferula flavus]